MAMFRSDQENQKEAETVIGPSVKVEGNFSSDGDVVIEGQLTGTLKTSKNVRIGQGARIKADVEAASIFQAGEIRGNVKVSEKLQLKSTAKIFGNVETNILSVEEGGMLNGKCQMGKKEGAVIEVNHELFVSDDKKKNKK
ncbi:MAG: polymer-forming cytoskeletal protein [Patescibacteria group bacterium]